MTADAPGRRQVNVLASFYYFARADLPRLIARAADQGVDVDFFADSGAFSAHTSGAKISVKQYATWLRLHAPHINCAATLDVIGDPAASARNTRELEDLVAGEVYILPIFHVGSPWPELERWCKTHPYVGLGGAVGIGRRGNALIRWLVRAHKIAREHGAVFHGFGMTRPPYPDLFPWYSVDSSFWSSGARNGTVTLFDQRTAKLVCVRHVDDINRGVRRNAQLIRSYGMDPRTLSEPGFGLVSQRGKEQGRAERDWISTSALESWMRYADHLRTRRRPVDFPRPVDAGPTVTGTGPKVFLAVGSVDDFDMVTRVAADRAITDHVIGQPA